MPCRIARHMVLLLAGLPLSLAAAEPALQGEAETALRRAVEYYRTRVAVQGGYVYHYSLDLKQRFGEGVASPQQIWVQPPGTPTVGRAYLRAYEATGDRYYLDAATETAEALVYGQLDTGGWQNNINVETHGKATGKYAAAGSRRKGTKNSTLDDGITQSALQLLMLVDQAHEFKHEPIHKAVEFAQASLRAAQYPNGAFPQVWRGTKENPPIKKASFPTYDYRTEGRIKNYWDMYTLNDGLSGTVAETLWMSWEIYHNEEDKAALVRLGDFLILAQLPEPQPGWAQQYSYDMHPIWARRFEPAAVTGGESQDVMETLIKIARWTGDKKYLEPIPRAIAYFERSQLPDGRLARYYEMKSNRPLYMIRSGDKYSLTYDDRDLPDHYGWKVESRLAEIKAQLEKGISAAIPKTGANPNKLASRVQQIIADLDKEGRWVSESDGLRLIGDTKFPKNEPYLSSAVFSRNVEMLSDYLAAVAEN